MAQVFHAAETYLKTDPVLSKRNQPDILSMHVDFLNPGEHAESIITITPLRVGAVASTLQVSLSQKEKVRIVATITSTNFDKSLGPSGQTAWALHPPQPPKPDLERVLVNKPDENWVPFTIEGEVLALSRRLVTLYPRKGFETDGVCDYWLRYKDREPLHALQLAALTDNMPAMSDTILRNNGLYDGHAVHKEAVEIEAGDPGKPAIINHTWERVFQSTIFPVSLTLDLEFKQRLPEDGLRIVNIRQATKTLNNGRMDFESTIMDEHGALVCNARQIMLILSASRKFSKGSDGTKAKASL